MYRVLRIAILIAVLLLIAFAVSRLLASLERAPSVQVIEAQRTDAVRVLALTGRIRPEFTATVQPTVGGRLTSLSVAEGSQVEQGQIVARIDSGPERARLQQSQASFEEQLAEQEQSERDLERATRLFEDGLLAENELDSARLRVARNEQSVRELRERIRENEARLEDFHLRAPFAGWVLRRPVDPGQTVAAGTVVYEISTRSTPMVEVEVDELYLDEMTQGLKARVAPLRATGEVWEATLVYVARQVNPDTASGTVRLAFDQEHANRARELPAGLSVDVNIEVARHDDALTVPRKAILSLGAQPQVLIVKETQDEQTAGEDAVLAYETATRAIQVIDWPAPELVVLGGLEQGEQVVLEPRGIEPGVEVRPQLATRSEQD